ncbi:MAG: type IV secretion system protein [Rickettsia sp.]|nr:type IV secretion system protein [Rickettsia sp.]
MIFANILEQKYLCTKPLPEETTDIRYQNFFNRIQIFADDPNECNQSEIFHFCILDLNDSSKCYEETEKWFLSSNTSQSKSLSSIVNLDPLFNDLEIKYIKEENSNDFQKKISLAIATVDGDLKLVSRTIETKARVPEPPKCGAKNFHSTKDCIFKSLSDSQILSGILGANILCIRDGIYNQFLKENECSTTADNNSVLINNVWNFRSKIERAVTAVIILYVIVIGFQILGGLSNQDSQSQEEWDTRKAIVAAIKIIFVLYLSIGFKISDSSSENPSKVNAVEQFILPISFEIIDKISVMVFNVFLSKNSTNQDDIHLCKFDIKKYSDSRFHMWDSFECRMLYYLGSNSVIGKFKDVKTKLENVENITINHLGTVNSSQAIGMSVIDNQYSPDSLSDLGNLNLFTVLGYMLLIPNLQIHIVFILLFLIYVILSYLFFFIAIYLISTLVLFLVGYLSPILVIFFLFKNTEYIFLESCKLIFSCILLPIVLVGFVSIILSLYDAFLQPECEFQKSNYILNVDSQKNQTFSTFTISSRSNVCKNSMWYQVQEYFYGHHWKNFGFLFWNWSALIVKANLITNFFQILFLNIIFLMMLQKISEFLGNSFSFGKLH